MAKKAKRNKRRKVNTRIITIVSVSLALFTVIFAFRYLDEKTIFFNIIDVNVTGSEAYPKDYLVKKSGIVFGEKVYSIDRKEIEKNIEKQEYIKKCNVVYVLPNMINLQIIERNEKYLIHYNNEEIITDEEGYVVSANIHANKLFSIDLFTEINYNVGNKLYLSEYDDLQGINNLLEYTADFDDIDKIKRIELYSNDIIIIKTNYDLDVKMSLLDDIKYNYFYALTIIKTRLNNGEKVDGCLVDFTKGENPVFSYGDE